jgi:hypothetical protein
VSVMSTLMLNPTSVAQWHNLVHEAEVAIAEHLEEALESYLVFLLMRYTCQPALGTRVVALDYLEGLAARGRVGQQKLRDVGDCCLLFAGLFPELARRRRVAIHYFIELGQSAYATLSDEPPMQNGDQSTFNQLASGFVRLVDVLLTMRTLDGRRPTLQPVEAYELWHETGSRFAYQALSEQFNPPAASVDKTKNN